MQSCLLQGNLKQALDWCDLLLATARSLARYLLPKNYEGKLEESLCGEHRPGESPRNHHHGLRPISNFDDLLEKLAPALSTLQEGFADLSNETGQLSEVKEEPQDETTKQAEIDHAKV